MATVVATVRLANASQNWLTLATSDTKPQEAHPPGALWIASRRRYFDRPARKRPFLEVLRSQTPA